MTPDVVTSDKAARARALVEAGSLAALVVAGTWLQHGPGGIQAPWIAFVLLLAGSFFRRWLVVRGRARPVPLLAFALELAGFAGALGRLVPPWALALEGAAALATAWSIGAKETLPDDPGPAASRLERAAPLALGCLALAFVVTLDPERGHPGSPALLGALAIWATFACAPGAATTTRASARRFASAGILAAEALLALYQEAPATFLAEDATRALAFVAAGLEVLAYVRERTEPAPVPERVRRAARMAFGTAVAALALLVVPYRLLAPERRLELEPLPGTSRGVARETPLPVLSLDAPPDTALLLEDGRPLERPEVFAATVAALGSGRYAVSRSGVVWSSSDGTDPLANGRRYELVFRPEPHRSLPGELLFGLALGLLLVAWSVGAIDLRRPSSPRERALATLVVAAALAAGLPARWDRISVATDSDGYLTHTALRTPLYPAFLDAFDARPDEPRTGFVHDRNALGREDPTHRFLGAVRAQKVLAAGSLALLVWVLAGSWNAWLLAALVGIATLADLGTYGDGSAAWNLGSLMSEGLNLSLLFLFIAAAFAYLRRPGRLVGGALAVLVALLLLDRPANAPLAIVFAAVWLRHARQEGVRFASLRTVGLALVTAIPLLGACAQTYRATGYFRLHAFTGPSIFCTTFSLATPDDVDAFPEPELHELMRRCILEQGSRRISTRSIDFANVNLYDIGLPTFEAVVPHPPGARGDYVRDDLLAVVGKRLVRRHPVEFARLVLEQLGSVLTWTVHGPLAVAFVASALLWWRRRRPLDLFGAWLCALPVLAILPSCVFNVPLGRYRSQLDWAEVVAVPLVLALAFAPEPAPPLAKPDEPGASP